MIRKGHFAAMASSRDSRPGRSAMLSRSLLFLFCSRFSSSSLIKIVAAGSLALMLVSGAWAKTKFKVLHAVGGGLFSGMALDAKGNLYGATNGGGDHGDGSIFELSKNSKGTWTLTTLHSFTGDGGDGAYPNGNSFSIRREICTARPRPEGRLFTGVRCLR